MRCEELLAALNQYVDGELDPGICDPFQEHLKGCWFSVKWRAGRFGLAG